MDMITAGTSIVSVMFAVFAVLQSTVMGRFCMSGSIQKLNRHAKETILEG